VPDQRDFLLTEYDHLRREVERLGAETRTLARYALVITGGIYGWFAARLLDPDVGALDATFKVFTWTPAVVTLLFGVRCLALGYGIRRIAPYIQRIESEFRLPDGLGWETHLRDTRKRIMFWSATLYWVILFAVTVVAPFFCEVQVDLWSPPNTPMKLPRAHLPKEVIALRAPLAPTHVQLPLAGPAVTRAAYGRSR